MGWTRLLIPFACISLTLVGAACESSSEQAENCTGLFGHHPNFILCATGPRTCTFYWKSETTDPDTGDLVERSCSEICGDSPISAPCAQAYNENNENECNNPSDGQTLLDCTEPSSDAICVCGL